MSARRSTRRGGFGLMLLATEIMRIGPNRIPPVTLISVAINVAIYMGIAAPVFPSVHGACTSNYYVLNKKQWMRLIYSSFYHLDDMHLYYNMVSFIWKGLKLERKMKSLKFAIVIVLFSVLTQVFMLILNRIFAEIFLNPQYLRTCAAGFSAVIFALKVLTTASSDDSVHVMGMPLPVPARYACWVELILIHLLVPNSSFTGHLSGIIVGLLYTKGPLRMLVKAVKYLISGDFVSNLNRQSYVYTASPTGHSDENEEIQRAIQESLRYTNFQSGNVSSSGARNFQDRSNQSRSQPPSYGWNIPDDSASQPQDQLYPTLPNDFGQSTSSAEPSAPPFEDVNNQPYIPPYPSNNAGNNLPYPKSGSHVPYPSNDMYPPAASSQFSSQPIVSDDYVNDEYSQDSMRAARLRRFGKKI